MLPGSANHGTNPRAIPQGQPQHSTRILCVIAGVPATACHQ
jgi:hypothetical protein